MAKLYPPEVLDSNYDDGTMPDNRDHLAEAVVGHRIVSAEKTSDISGHLNETDPYKWRWNNAGLVLTLDDGTKVVLADTSDCCAYTELEAFLLHPEMVDHVIVGVGTTEEFYKWHIYADAGDVLELTVGWSSGNPFYYGYGFSIDVIPVKE